MLYSSLVKGTLKNFEASFSVKLCHVGMFYHVIIGTITAWLTFCSHLHVKISLCDKLQTLEFPGSTNVYSVRQQEASCITQRAMYSQHA